MKSLRAKVGTALLQVPSVAAIIRDERGDLLLQRRASDGAWSLPAGAIDPGESPARAVVREVWEETGLRVIPVRLIALLGGESYRHTYENGDRVEYTVALFACRITGGELGGRDGESIELRYVDPAAMPALALPYPDWVFTAGLQGETFFDWDDRWLDHLE
jgi:8-oxo-dGTP pyrophosphatase MutT (NUDIX family)